MSRRRLLLVSWLLLCGCRGGPVVQQTDRILLEIASHPIDVAPPETPQSKPKPQTAPSAKTPSKNERRDTNSTSAASEPESDVRTVALLQGERSSDKPEKEQSQYELQVPAGLPGSESLPLPDLSKLSPQEKQRAIQRLYPELPPLPVEPRPEPGPKGIAYTLADLQRLAAENSPTLRQAVADVKGAEGNLVQARTYSNPTIAPFYLQPNNNNAAAGAPGVFLEQSIPTFGKKKMQTAAAQKQLDNAQLALKRTRFDLTTNVRNAYFILIVAKERMRVNGALVQFTDEIYRLFTGYLAAGVVATYEPAPLRAQAYANRLVYKQAIIDYEFAWKALIAVLGLEQLPLTEVDGRVDRFIPYYDYDKVLAYILANHTDVLTARNAVQIAQYNLKLAQITPFGDFNLQYGVNKEVTVAPFVYYNTFMVGMPLPIFDQNRGNIIYNKAQVIHAVEESHRVENVLTNTLATNYTSYKNNLYALEYYRRYILPDQVTYYRGVFERRQVDQTASAGELLANLVTAQQALTLNVQNYLGILGSLWSAVVSVADLIQTPDLFQLAKPHELPPAPELDQMPHWLCPHHRSTAPTLAAMQCNDCAPVTPIVKPVPVPSGAGAPTVLPESDPVLPSPRRSDPPSTGKRPQVRSTDVTRQLLEPPPDVPKKMKRNDEGVP